MLKGVASKTAELGAMIRAVACRNKYGKKIFYDPCSKYFIGPKIRFICAYNRIASFINPAFWCYGMNSVGFLLSLCRHRFMSDYLKGELENSMGQIVILGAGYDTNFENYKKNLENKKYIEVDFPATQKRKKKILEKKFNVSNLVLIPADLNKENIHVVLENQIDQTKPVLVIIEGLLSYLNEKKVLKIITSLKSISKSVKIIADYRKPTLKENRNYVARKWIKSFRSLSESYTSFFKEEDISNLLSDAGYHIEHNFDLFDLWNKYSELEPNKELTDFGGLFVVSYGF